MEEIRNEKLRSWYRRMSRDLMPNKERLAEENAVDTYILKGWLPSAPFITQSTKLIAFGSCFAREITSRLSNYGLDAFEVKYKRVPIVFASDMFNTTFTIKQQFEWAFKGWVPDDHLWWTINKEPVSPLEEYRVLTKQAVIDADVFILTLGLAEVWYNKETGGVFWCVVPKDEFDADVHRFKVSTVEENRGNLECIWEMIKDNNPEAKVVFTLSPVPLKATYRDNSCVTSNAVSKAILRAAVDEFVRAHPDNLNNDLFYWPSYEIAKEYFTDPYKDDNRHIKDEAVDVIVDLFVKYFVV